ncbi:MAG: DUF3800 domain-containing protein [bacterium]|nr:DUF3800 domain-containing protein [bacterium]
MYIFIDESGQFTKHNHEKYFVIGSFTVGDQRRTNKSFRSWIRTKFPRKMRTQSEVKWSASGINDDLRLRTLKFIAKLDVRIKYGFLLRKNIPVSFRQKGKIESGALYTNIIGEILEMYLPVDEKEIYIFCDCRSLKGMTKKEFETSIISRLLPLCAPNTLVRVEMIDSTANANIQIADWVSGALARHLEGSLLGSDCYKILKNNFLGDGKEFFVE